METGFSKGSQRQFCRQTSFHLSGPCFLPLFRCFSPSLARFLSAPPVFANGSRGKKKKKNQEAMFPKTAT